MKIENTYSSLGGSRGLLQPFGLATCCLCTSAYALINRTTQHCLLLMRRVGQASHAGSDTFGGMSEIDLTMSFHSTDMMKRLNQVVPFTETLGPMLSELGGVGRPGDEVVAVG